MLITGLRCEPEERGILNWREWQLVGHPPSSMAATYLEISTLCSTNWKCEWMWRSTSTPWLWGQGGPKSSLNKFFIPSCFCLPGQSAFWGIYRNTFWVAARVWRTRACTTILWKLSGTGFVRHTLTTQLSQLLLPKSWDLSFLTASMVMKGEVGTSYQPWYLLSRWWYIRWEWTTPTPLRNLIDFSSHIL